MHPIPTARINTEGYVWASRITASFALIADSAKGLVITPLARSFIPDSMVSENTLLATLKSPSVMGNYPVSILQQGMQSSSFVLVNFGMMSTNR